MVLGQGRVSSDMFPYGISQSVSFLAFPIAHGIFLSSDRAQVGDSLSEASDFVEVALLKLILALYFEFDHPPNGGFC